MQEFDPKKFSSILEDLVKDYTFSEEVEVKGHILLLNLFQIIYLQI